MPSMVHRSLVTGKSFLIDLRKSCTNDIQCSVTCNAGTQHRVVMCKNREEIVSPEKCNGLNRPSTTRQCHMMPCPLGSSKANYASPSSAAWIPSEWTQVGDFQKTKSNSSIVNSISF